MRYSISAARAHANRQEYREALEHYLFALTSVTAEARSKYTTEFVACFRNYIDSRNGENTSKAESDSLTGKCDCALRLFRGNATVYFEIAQILGSLRMFTKASETFNELVSTCRPSEITQSAVRVCQANLSSQLFPAWHMLMLNNFTRNSAYAEAIRRLSPGKTVLEIGSGTGLLSAIAHSHGLQVIAVEECHRLCEITEKVLEMNRSNPDLMTRSYPCNSKKLDIEKEIGRKADVVVAEIFDCCGLGEGVLESFADAHRRLAIPGAFFIPNTVTIYATVIESPSIWKTHRHEHFRTEYVHLPPNLASEPYWCSTLNEYNDVRYLSDAVPIMNINLCDLAQLEKLIAEGQNQFFKFETTLDGTAHCLAVHWRANLGDGLILDSGMDDSCWDYGIYPIRHPKPLVRGDKVEVSVWLSDGGRRLDLVVTEELFFLSENDHQLIPVSGSYVTLCHDEEFSRVMCEQIPSTASSVYISVAFDYHQHLMSNFNEIDLDNLEGDPFSVLLINKAVNPSEIYPPFEYVIFWPVLSDGSLDDSAIFKNMPNMVMSWNSENDRPPTQSRRVPICIPGVLSCVGQLVYANSLAEKCRLQPNSHLGFDLKSPDHPMRLFETREINLPTFQHTLLSSEFTIYDFNLQEIFDHPCNFHYDRYTDVVEVECTKSGEVDGVLYWWKAGGYESKSQPCAAFVFAKRRRVVAGEKLTLRIDLYKAQLLVTLDCESPAV